MFSGDFCLVLTSEVKFSFQTKKEQRRTKKQRAVFVCFVCLCMPFFSVPSSGIQCLALWGGAGGEVFFNFPGISLVSYFFGVQKPCRDILREFTRSDRAKGLEQSRGEHTAGIVSGRCPKSRKPPFGDTGDSVAVFCCSFTLPFEKHLLW